MKTSYKFNIPKPPANPLEYITSKSDEPMMDILKRALENKNVFLSYQPIVYAQNPNKVSFYEGLIRILDNKQELIEAKNFIPLVENTELGRVLDCHALELGLTALKTEATLRLSINMSARSIGYPLWMEILNKELKVNPEIGERLILEITETSVISMPEVVTVFMENLRKRGINFALDDFGAGYTAFRFFKELQFDILKIDGQFIKNINKDADNQVLATALTSIGKQFEMLTVAEHVETAEDMLFLQNMGIDCLQGYHIGYPKIIKEWTESKYQSDG